MAYQDEGMSESEAKEDLWRRIHHLESKLAAFSELNERSATAMAQTAREVEKTRRVHEQLMRDFAQIYDPLI